MVLLKMFIEPFRISDHLLQFRSLSQACALVTWWKYSLCFSFAFSSHSFFPQKEIQTSLILIYTF